MFTAVYQNSFMFRVLSIVLIFVVLSATSLPLGYGAISVHLVSAQDMGGGDAGGETREGGLPEGDGGGGPGADNIPGERRGAGVLADEGQHDARRPRVRHFLSVLTQHSAGTRTIVVAHHQERGAARGARGLVPAERRARTV